MRMGALMKKLFYRLLSATPLLVIASAAFASSDSTIDQMPDQFVNLFSPSSGDLSLTYLSQMFGSVGNILSGDGGQLLGQMFGIMNKGILAIMGIVFSYATFKLIIDTANDGEVMGKGKNFALSTLRTVLGLSLAIPSATTGYCLAQNIVMWATVQGVGLADHAWSRVIQYLDEGGQLYVANAPNDNSKLGDLIVPTTNLLRAEVCMYKLRDVYSRKEDSKSADLIVDPNDTGKNIPALTVLPPSKSQIKIGYSINKNNTITFGSYNTNYKPNDPTTGNQYNSECGTVDWSQTNLSTKNKETNRNYVDAGVRQLVLDLGPIAKKIADFNRPVNGNMQTIHQAGLDKQTQIAIVSAIINYSNIIRPAMISAKNDAKDNLADSLAKSGREGWVTAGSYYRTLSQINNNLEITLDGFVPGVMPPSADNKGPAFENLTPTQLAEVNSSIGKVEDLITVTQSSSWGNKTTAKRVSVLPDLLANYNKAKGDANDWGISTDEQRGLSVNDLATMGLVTAGAGAALTGLSYAASGGPAGAHAAVITGSTTAAIISFMVIWGETINRPGDPILKLQQLGQGMTAIAVSLWLVVTSALFWLTVVSHSGSSISGVSAAVSDSTRWFSTVTFAIMTAFFASGMVLSVYVPLIPYIIYTFAVIGWIIGVLEAMVAAPMVALGLSHPEGHDLLTKAEQGIMMILGVFLRPLLLLIGLLAALILAQVCVKVINAGFSTVVSDTQITLSGANIFATMGLMIVYTLMQTYVIQLSCGLITGLKDKALAVLGHHPERESHDQILQTAQGAIHGQAQTAGHAGWEGTKEGAKNMPQSGKGASAKTLE